MSLPNNHNLTTSSSDNTKSTHVYFASVKNSTSMKRCNALEAGDDSSCKKLRYDMSPNTTWSISSTSNKANSKSVSSQYLKKDGISKSIALSCDSSDDKKLITLNSTASSPKDEVIVIRNFDATDYSEITPTSPLQTNANDEYVLFASDVVDYVDNNDCLTTNIKTNLNKEIPKSTTLPLDSISLNCSSSSMINKESHLSGGSSVEYKNLKNTKNTDLETSDSIELVLLPTLQESKINMTKSETTNKTLVPRIATVPSNNVIRNNSVPTLTSNQAKSNVNQMFNRVNIHTTLKNQPVVVSTKKLMSEVTQPTAKVSFGNTTISVPLLKPLNSTQRVQTSGTIGEVQKTMQSSIQQQTQLNMSKILNVKRGQKINQPTIVSLSQLQIKPVTTAKIVQAKVVGKKLPLPVSIGTPVTTPAATISTHTLLENAESSLEGNVKIIGTSSNIQKTFSSESKATTSDDQTAGIKFDEKSDVSGTVKSSLPQKSVNEIPPLVATLSKSINQQHQFPNTICSTMSIIRQSNNTTLSTSSGGATSFPIITTDSKTQTDVQNNMANLNVNSGHKLNTTPLITKPRNISLMYTKNPINQSVKAVSSTSTIPAQIVTTITADNLKKIGISKANTANISVSSSTTNPPMPQLVDSFSKQEFTSISVQPYDAKPTSEITSSNSTSIKIPCSSTTVSQQTIKRSKSSDEVDRDLNGSNLNLGATKRKSIESLTTKRQGGSSEDNLNANAPDTQCGTMYNNTNIKTTFSVPITIANSSIVAKSEETNNVLLKQLLQNSSTPHNTNQNLTVNNCVSTSLPTTCNQVISARKVINVRAPSLGLVSSLEAQLARPVIPPVPANSTTSQQLNVSPQLKSLKHIRETTTEQNVEHENVSQQNDTKTKPSVQIISKETSFVSKPTMTVSTIETHQRSKLNDNTSTDSTPPLETTVILNTHNKLGNTNISPSISLEKKKSVDNKNEIHDSTVSSNKSSCASATTSDTVSTTIVQTTITLSNSESTGDKSLRFQNLLKTENRSRLNENLLKLNTPSNVQSITTVNVPFKTNTKSVDEHSVARSNLDVSHNTDKQKNDIDNFKKDISLSSGSAETSTSASIAHTLNDSGTIANDNASTTPQNVDVSKSNVKSTDCGPRKKRKREYQKHRRQLIGTNNVVASNSVCNNTNLKKRPRKLSKMEEDYDNFIDNLIVNIRQMQPLQVLEPLLNRSFNIYNIYGKRNSMRTVPNKSSLDAQQQFLLGDYGAGYHPHISTYYDAKTFKSLTTKENLTSIQNNFYDQEFLPVLFKNEQYTLSRFVSNMREKNIDIDDVAHHQKDNLDVQKNIKWNTLSRIPYPGLILMNNLTSHCLGRMSPVLPLVEPFSLKINHVIKPFKAMSVFGLKSKVKNNDAESNESDLEQSKNSENNNTVIISLPSSAACNIMGILKDLANLLHISVPVTYKVLNEHEINTEDNKQINSITACQRSHKYKNLQQILSGRRRMCRNCGVSIQSLGIRISKTTLPSSSVKHNENNFSSGYLYFCGRTCYAQFKWTNRRHSAFVVTTNKNTFEFNNSKTETNIKTTVDKNNKCDTERKCGLKYYNSICFTPNIQLKHPNEKELVDILFKMGVTISPYNTRLDTSSGNVACSIEDSRQCIFCNERGDGLSDGTSRLLNFNVDKWVHLNCALWSNDVYETISGGLMNFQAAFQAGLNQTCNVCHQVGATLKCFKHRCGATFHLPCAIREKCVFYKNKTIHCQNHASRLDKENELQSLTVQRRVYVERDENHQVAAVMHHSELSNLLRVGSLTFLSIGQLLPHQLDAFHNSNYIYPVGYKVVRFYWSMRKPHKRCRYICSIMESAGRPEFLIQVQEPMESDIEFRDVTPKAVWQRVLEPIAALRKECDLVQLFPQFISGEDLFGLTEPAIVRIIESLPGVENLTNYRFKFGRNPLLELPLAINPTGAARTEPKQRQLLGWRKSHTQRTSNNFNQRLVTSVNTVVAGEVSCPYSKQFVHSKSSQYKKMKQEWRNNVFLARSKIQGLGLYSARDMEKHTMIIEYIGEVIRTEVSEIREKQYEARNRGIYMFRLDEERVVDATLSGGLARYINHSCNPNCVTEIMEVDRELRIIISAKRRISRGEELSYDYKFDLEDDEHKISCMCGAPNCRKWMN